MEDLVIHSNRENWTTSTLIAKEFGKSHDFLLKKIRKLLKALDDLARQKKRTKQDLEKFILEDYVNDMGHTYARYRMNKPAFSLLIMQMSGIKVIEVQRAFNKAFYDMEQHILKLQNADYIAVREQSKVARLEVTDSIQELIEYATKQGSTKAKFYYKIITTETYKALGFLAKGEKVGSEFRNHLDKFQLHELVMAEAWAARVIRESMDEGLHYKEIYLLAKQKVVEFGKAQEALRLPLNTNLIK